MRGFEDKKQIMACSEKILFDLFSIFMDFTDFDEAMNKALMVLGNFISVSRIYVFEISEDKKSLSNVYEWNADGGSSEIEIFKDMPIFERFPWWMKMLRSDSIINISDVSTMIKEADAEKTVLDERGIKSVLVFPLILHGDLKGFIGADECKDKRIWSHADIHCFHFASHIISAAYDKRDEVLERQHYKKKLEESEHRYRQLVESAQDIIFRIDKDGVLLDSNRDGVLGYARDEKIGAGIDLFLTEESMILVRKKLTDAMKINKIEAPIEVEVKAKDGSIIPFEVSASPLFKDGKFDGCIAVARDIRERKELEKIKERLQEELRKKAWHLEKKVEGLMETRLNLTAKERRMLYYLSRFPSMSDNKLAVLAKIKRSTITAIRNRLVKEGVLEFINIPNISRIYKGNLNFTIGSYSRPLDRDTITSLFSKHAFDGNDLIFLSTDKDFIVVSASHGRSNSLKKRLANDSFPLSVVNDYSFSVIENQLKRCLDFSGLIKTFFALDVEHSPSVLPSGSIVLSRNERKLLYAFVKYPAYSITEISKLIGISKPTVSTIRSKLLSKGVIISTAVPDLKRLGASLAIFRRCFGKNSSVVDPFDQNCVVSMLGPQNQIGFYVYKDYEDFKSTDISETNDNCQVQALVCNKISNLKIDFLPFLRDVLAVDDF